MRYIETTIQNIEKLPQDRRPLVDQLIDLISAANRLGLYDAADFVAKQVGQNPEVFQRKAWHSFK